MRDVGVLRQIYRYPVKSMAGEPLDGADLGWHGVEGDRRAAFVRTGDRSGFPWLTASKLPSLVTYRPVRDPAGSSNATPLHVETPRGDIFELAGEQLATELAAAYGAPVALTEWKNGIFDDASVSVLTTSTVAAICEAAGVAPDTRRFRPNLLVESHSPMPFADDEWVGRTMQCHPARAQQALIDCAPAHLQADTL